LRNLVTGGSGFIGSHLIKRLLNENQEVISLDNYFTGNKGNLENFNTDKNLKIIEHDVTDPIFLEVDRIWHLACPASPVHYQFNPIKTAKTSFLGTYNMLGLAKRVGAKILMASTSEVYGDPKVHPQPESYTGSVNTIGIRSCYDEGKRIAETLCADYKRIHNVNVSIARIFNTYGPNMLENDGRVVSNFIVQALKGESLTIYGNGLQTRSFCYVDDLIDGLVKLMDNNFMGPVNLGNPTEFSILELAEKISKKINPEINILFKPLPEDDPLQRKPIIEVAKRELNWEPKIDLNHGLDKTISYFRKIVK
tara:strand:- start:476 stop:1402 length:927 start_codon:yes stop_codon:yes gene_type:complete